MMCVNAISFHGCRQQCHDQSNALMKALGFEKKELETCPRRCDNAIGADGSSHCVQISHCRRLCSVWTMVASSLDHHTIHYHLFGCVGCERPCYMTSIIACQTIAYVQSRPWLVSNISHTPLQGLPGPTQSRRQHDLLGGTGKFCVLLDVGAVARLCRHSGLHQREQAAYHAWYR